MLNTLPNELLNQILSQLRVAEVKALRLTSKGLEAVASSYLLSSLEIPFRADHYERLEAVAKSDKFNGCIQRLCLDTTTLPECPSKFEWMVQVWACNDMTFKSSGVTIKDFLGKGDIIVPTDTTYEIFKVYESLYKQQEITAHALQYLDVLEHAVGRFSNLTAFEVIACNKFEPAQKEALRTYQKTFVYPRRRRADEVLMSGGEVPDWVGPKPHPTSYLGMRELQTFAASAILYGVHIQTLKLSPLHYIAFELTEDNTPSDALTNCGRALSKLKTLRLEVFFGLEYHPVQFYRHAKGPLKVLAKGGIRAFLEGIPTLEDLTVDFDFGPDGYYHDGEGMCDRVPVSWILGMDTCAMLTSLSLDWVSFSQDQFLEMLGGRRTLRKVALKQARLSSGTWFNTFARISDVVSLTEFMCHGIFNDLQTTWNMDGSLFGGTMQFKSVNPAVLTELLSIRKWISRVVTKYSETLEQDLRWLTWNESRLATEIGMDYELMYFPLMELYIPPFANNPD
ncbi:hypothetical protein MMC25_005973 [Agyrium rufum]|nr:hypothetical protein [Agyrium rufum]